MGRPLPRSGAVGGRRGAPAPGRRGGAAAGRSGSRERAADPACDAAGEETRAAGQAGRAFAAGGPGAAPEDFWLNYALGEALRERKPAEAVGFYRAALKTRPTVAAVHLEVGAALGRLGQGDEAFRPCRKAVELEPMQGPVPLFPRPVLAGPGPARRGDGRIPPRHRARIQGGPVAREPGRGAAPERPLRRGPHGRPSRPRRGPDRGVWPTGLVGEVESVRANARPRHPPAGAPPGEGAARRARTTGVGPLVPGIRPAARRSRPVRRGLRRPTGPGRRPGQRPPLCRRPGHQPGLRRVAARRAGARRPAPAGAGLAAGRPGPGG